jgi:hypothetical protein
MRFLFTFILLVLLVISTNGCVTASAVQAAKGETLLGDPAGEPNKGYYALLPLTIPVDIVTSPFQAIGFLYLEHLSRN